MPFSDNGMAEIQPHTTNDAELQRARKEDQLTFTGPASTHFASATTQCNNIAKPRSYQPRVAAVLGLPLKWQILLFACRLLSLVPAIWWGSPVALRFLLLVHDLVTGIAADESLDRFGFEVRLLITERLLALMWCGCSSYLSFIFTDCLMSRWLVNYTPEGTFVRLLAINALNGYLQSWLLHPVSGVDGPLLLLLKWIGITSALTVTYHFTHRKTRIRKETFISISVFSGASYLSMILLLVLVHSSRNDWQGIRLFAFAEDAYYETTKFARQLVEPRVE